MPRTRRSRGEGSFHVLPDGRIRHLISLGEDPAGNRIRLSVTARSKADCRDLMARKLEEVRKHGGVPISDDTSLREWLLRWLERKEREVAAATWSQYESAVRLHIEPRLGRIRLDRLSVRDVDRWLTSLADDGLGGRARQYARMVLTNAINDAMRLELLDRNVAALVRAPRHVKAEFSVWDIDEALAFLHAAKTDRFEAFWVLWLTTGPRPHEMLGLRPEDVDVHNAALSITKQLRRGGQERVNTKTTTARRHLALAPIAVEAIQRHKARLLKDGLRASPWLFPSTTGGAMNYRNLIEDHYERIVRTADDTRRRELTRLELRRKGGSDERRAAGVPLTGELTDGELDAVAKRLNIVGLPRIRPYDLRHTYATLALRAGVPVKVVSESLGHADISLTLRTYAHVLASMREEHVERIQGLFGAAPREAGTKVGT